MSKSVNYILAVIAIVFILIYLKSILVPLVFAFIIWFLINEVKHIIDRVEVLRTKVPTWVKNVFSFALIYGIISAIVSFVSADLANISSKLPVYQENLLDVEASLNKIKYMEGDFAGKLAGLISSINFTNYITVLVKVISGLLGNAFLVLLYVIFMLAEQGKTADKMKNLFINDTERQKNMDDLLKEIHRLISRYLSMKTIISFITGSLSYVVLKIIGVDFAAFWAMLIFFLNYIPNIGSLVATLFPALMALIEFGELSPFFWVLGAIGGIQVIVGNFLEPKLLGDTLNISSLVVLLSLAFWGLIWGLEGMILCVPITVILIIILARFPNTRFIAVLLSENGKV